MLLDLDAGESAEETEELWRLADILAVACGGHAGDEASMERVVRFCAARGRAIGAHPSYPDRAGFGRTTMAIDEAALRTAVGGQCAALAAIARRHGVDVAWVKPHGALYHDAAAHDAIARAVVRGAVDALGEVVVIGPPEGALRRAAVGYLREGFADRGTRADGTLIPRGEPGALVTDPGAAAARVAALAGRADVICVHADTPGAVAIARAVRGALDG